MAPSLKCGPTVDRRSTVGSGTREDTVAVPDVYAFEADEEQHRAPVPRCLLSVLQRERGQHRGCPERDGRPLGPGGREPSATGLLARLSQGSTSLRTSFFCGLVALAAFPTPEHPRAVPTPAHRAVSNPPSVTRAPLSSSSSSVDLEDELSGEDAGARPPDETGLAQLFSVCVSRELSGA